MLFTPLAEKSPVQTFFPQETKKVPASQPLPAGTHYAVSCCLEHWGAVYLLVVKIQMIINGKIVDRSPSIPLGSQDHQKIMWTIEDLFSESAKEGSVDRLCKH